MEDISRKDSNGLKKNYSIENLYNSEYVYMFDTLGSRNILKVTICLKDLDIFKKDLYNLTEYRTIWSDETIYNYFNNLKIID